MTTYSIFTLILCILTLLLYYRRVRQYYIDQSIYELRRCKHDIIMYLGNNIDTLKLDEINDLKLMYKNVINTHDMFLNIGGLKFKTVRVIINNTLTSAKIETHIPQIIVNKPELFTGYANAIRCSLKAIPLLRIRLITHVIKMGLKFLILIGLRNGKRNLAKFEQFLNIENQKLNDQPSC